MCLLFATQPKYSVPQSFPTLASVSFSLEIKGKDKMHRKNIHPAFSLTIFLSYKLCEGNVTHWAYRIYILIFAHFRHDSFFSTFYFYPFFDKVSKLFCNNCTKIWCECIAFVLINDLYEMLMIMIIVHFRLLR